MLFVCLFVFGFVLFILDSDEEIDIGLISDDEEDDGVCDIEEYLVVLGIRFLLFVKFENVNLMFLVIELFYCCIFEDFKERLSVKDIVVVLKFEILVNDIIILE